jgi:predicted GIY-YIG superfamily endonuclease
MAEIEQRGSRFRARFHHNYYRYSATFDSRDEAERWAIESKRLARSGIVPKKQGIGKRPRLLVAPNRPIGVGLAEIVAAARPYERICGVYFLIRHGSVIYVGQSLDVMRRIAAHRIQFDSYHVLPIAPALLDLYESHYIASLRPELNRLSPTSPLPSP